MHVLYCLPGYEPAWRLGGPLIAAVGVAERLVQMGHRVTVLATNCNLGTDLDVPLEQPVDINGVEVWYFQYVEPLKNLLSAIPYLSQSVGYLHSRGMRHALSRITPSADVVHTQMPYVYPTYAAARAAAYHNKPFFYHQHGAFNPVSMRIRLLKKLLYIKLIEIPILRDATTLIALTEQERMDYRRLGVATHCEVIPNGLNVDRYTTVPDHQALEHRGLRSEHQVILFLARLHPNKGADRLVKAFLRVKDLFPLARLCIAGPDYYGVEPGLRSCVERAGASDRVLFFGAVQGELKSQLLARADLFCLPSAAEGFSVAALEALASGTAALLTPACNFGEVAEAQAGHICDSDPSALALALVNLLGDPAALRDMGRRGRQLVEAKYSCVAIADRFVAAYQEGVERYRRALESRE